MCILLSFGKGFFLCLAHLHNSVLLAGFVIVVEARDFQITQMHHAILPRLSKVSHLFSMMFSQAAHRFSACS